MHVTINAQLSLAVDAARLVIAKISRRLISSEIANAEHSNASSASQDDERARYALWSSAIDSFRKKTYLLVRKIPQSFACLCRLSTKRIQRKRCGNIYM